MFKFIRRLFVILILIVVVFLVYRYINPNGASRIMDKIKSIPTTISSWFSKDDSEFVLDSKTISLTGDLQVINSGENLKKDSEENDKLWLETLNKEIESILGKDKKEVVVDETILTGTKEIVENIGLGMSGEVETNLNTGIVVEANTGYIIETTKKEVETVVTNTISNVNNTVKKAKKTLSDLDKQQIRNVFGNLFK